MTPAIGDGIDDRNYKIFNGTVPQEMHNDELILRILSNEGVVEMPARNVFSLPLTGVDSTSGKLENFVVVNDVPGDAEVCMIEFTKRFSRMTGVPREIELMRKAPGVLKEEWNVKNADLLARGVDPVAQNFISPVHMTFSEGATEVLESLGNETVTLRLYGVDLRQPHTL
jgi:hypothetical protein